MILPSDKGGGLVCLEKADYYSKIDEILSDSSTYELLDYDPSSWIFNKTVDIIKNWKSTNKIDWKKHEELYPTTRLLPRFYGVPKTHKAGIPLRPIVSFCGTVTAALSSFVASLIAPLVGKSPFHLKDAMTFRHFISNEHLHPDEVLVSFDITSLYTSIPVNKALNIIEARLEIDDTLPERTQLTPNEITRTLRFLLRNTFFIHNGRTFHQLNGVPMGSPVSAMVANIFMEDFEEKALSSFTHPIRFWRRYIDDTAAALQSRLVAPLLTHLNSQEPSIIFTHELEENGRLPFLDLHLTRHSNGTISTEVYRKPTSLGQYLHYDSHHPHGTKISKIKSLFRRAEAYSSSPELLQLERQRIRDDLRKNCYPSNLIHRIERETSIPATPPPQEWKGFAVMPYVKGVSEAISRILSSAKIKPVFRPIRTINTCLIHPKDKIAPSNTTGIVYQVPCQDCPAVYVGETKREMGERLKEHRGHLTNNHPDKSAVAEHAILNQHNINWASTQIVDKHRSEFGRRFKEAIHAFQQPGNMNRDGLLKIPPAWIPNIHGLKL